MGRINHREAGPVTMTKMQTALPTSAFHIDANRLKSLWLGDSQVSSSLIFFPRVLFFSCFAQMNLRDNLRNLLYSFTSLLNSICSKLASSLVFFQAKKSEPSCPDVKLQIACYLFLLLFLESRELQKNTQIV